MKRTILAVTVSIALAGCQRNDADRAQRDAYWDDRPADVVCRTLGEPFYSGQSTGKVTYDEGGRVTFVDRANGRLTTIEGECMIVYAGSK